MKKIIFFLVLLLIPFSVKAYYCNYDDYNKTLKKAGNVNIMASSEIVDDKANFTIKIYNLYPDQYVIDEKNKQRYDYAQTKDGVLTITNISKADTYKFSIYSVDNECNDDPLASLYSTIPSYNKYYKDELCIGAENYSLCQKWSEVNMDYESFKKNILTYKNSIVQKAEEEPIYKSIYEYILEFYLEYYYYLLPAIIIVGVSLILIIKKKENKFGL